MENSSLPLIRAGSSFGMSNRLIIDRHWVRIPNGPPLFGDDMKSWTLPVKQTDDGELYIELNDEILEGSGFKIGDTLNWKDLKDGSYSLTKAEGDLYLVEGISMFHMKFVVRAKEAEHAMDEVVMDDGTLKEFSQSHVDFNILGARKISQDEYFDMFNKDNGYLASWTDEQKLKLINTIDYEDH